MRVLIVEDDKALAAFLSSALSAESASVETQNDGAQARLRVVAEQFDLILLDLNLPGCDGVEILAAARRAQKAAAILVLTGRVAVEDRVRCLDLGADDCLVKPFALSELIARTRALLRRSQAAKESVLYCGDLEMDRVRRTVCRAGVAIHLTSTEFALAEFLLLHKGECVSRGELLEHVWKVPTASDTNIVDVYVNYVRRKLHHSAARPVIQTIRGEGYIMREAEGMRLGQRDEAGDLKSGLRPGHFSGCEAGGMARVSQSGVKRGGEQVGATRGRVAENVSTVPAWRVA